MYMYVKRLLPKALVKFTQEVHELWLIHLSETDIVYLQLPSNNFQLLPWEPIKLWMVLKN